MSDLSFFQASDLAPAFKAALRRDREAVIAVPFWGKGAIASLGLKRGSPVRIICNLSHPGCNPDVIEELIDLGIPVRTHRRLHAKIYVTPGLAIVGSSNVSSNGLNVEGTAAAGWIEANLASRDPDVIDEVTSFFETLWEDRSETRRIRPADIEAAREARKRVKPFLIEPPRSRTLLDAVREAPDVFASVYIAAYSDRLSKGARDQVKAVREGALPPRSGIDASDFRKADGCQFELVPQDAWLINLDCRNPKEPRYRGCAKTTGLRFARGDHEYDLAIVIPGMIRIGGRSYPVREDDERQLVAASKRILKVAGDRLLPIADLLRLLR